MQVALPPGAKTCRVRANTRLCHGLADRGTILLYSVVGSSNIVHALRYQNPAKPLTSEHSRVINQIIPQIFFLNTRYPNHILEKQFSGGVPEISRRRIFEV